MVPYQWPLVGSGQRPRASMGTSPTLPHPPLPSPPRAIAQGLNNVSLSPAALAAPDAACVGPPPLGV